MSTLENRRQNSFPRENLPFVAGGVALIAEGLVVEPAFIDLAHKSTQGLIKAYDHLESGEVQAYETTLQRAQEDGIKAMLGAGIVSPAVVLLGMLILYKSGVLRRNVKK